MSDTGYDLENEWQRLVRELIRIRREQGVSINELTKRTLSGKATISYIETMRHVPNVDTLTRMAWGLGYRLMLVRKDMAAIKATIEFKDGHTEELFFADHDAVGRYYAENCERIDGIKTSTIHKETEEKKE